MFSNGRDRAARRYEAALSPALAAWRDADGSWFDGTPESVDKRIAQCRVIQSNLRGAAGALAGTGGEMAYIAAEQELAGDRRGLEQLRRDLLTAGADRDNSTCQYDSGSMYGNQPLCSQPAEHLIHYHNGSSGPLTLAVCRKHLDAARGAIGDTGNSWPNPVDKVEKLSGRRLKSVRVRDEIRHGDYNDVREVDVEPTLEGFIDLLNSGPYGGGNVAHPGNKYAVEAWEKFKDTGRSQFGWRDFSTVPDEGRTARRRTAAARPDFPDSLMYL